MVKSLQFLSFLFVFGIIVLAHEFGHFIAARLVKIRVDVFSFGMGKRLFGRKVGSTDFRVSLVPIGGYVRLAGEEEMDQSQRSPDDLYAKNRGQRFLTFVMGSVMNLLLAVLLIAILNMTGVEVESYKLEKPEIGFIEKDSPASQAGFKVGDLIRTINGKHVANWKDVDLLIGTNPREKLAIGIERNSKKMDLFLNVSAVGKMEFGYAGFFGKQIAEIEKVNAGSPAAKAGLKINDVILAVNGGNYFDLRDIIQRSVEKEIVFSIKRGDERKQIAVVPQKNDQGQGIIGIKFTFAFTKTRFPFFQAISRSISESLRLVELTIDAFKKMVRGKLSPNQLSGPIDIARFSQQALSTGLSNFFMFIAFISLNLGIVNLFPIPGLDGGHLMILAIEAIIRRDLNQRLKTILIYVGFSLLLALMTFVILNDIRKFLPHGWGSLFPFIK